MRALFVTPSEVASGEGITALHMGQNVMAQSGDVHFLASAFTASFLKPAFPTQVTEFTPDPFRNRELWESALRQFRPDVVVFADYPLLFFSCGASRLADEAWAASLEAVEPALATLDHLGYAQKTMTVFFGPPHLTFQCQATPELPSRMHILLPCPMHEPSEVPERKGMPFRCWDSPTAHPQDEDELEDLREAYLWDRRGLLVFHSTPSWAWKFAEVFGLPYYSLLPRLLAYYLEGLPRHVTVVSVNNGNLLPAFTHPNIHVVNVGTLPHGLYERLLKACDLMITENGVSVGLGKAVCYLRPCAVLRNRHGLEQVIREGEGPLRQLALEMEGARLGSVFPYEVFPIWREQEIEQLGLFRNNSITAAFARLEVFGGRNTRELLHRLLIDQETRAAMRSRQQAYVQRLLELGDSTQALREVVRRHLSVQ